MCRRAFGLRPILASIVLLGLLTSIARTQEKKQARAVSPEMTAAFRLFRSGETEKGIQALRKLIAKPETSSYDLFMCGELCFTKLRKLDVAIEAFTQLLARGDKARADLGDREVWMAHDAMGICLGMSGRFPEAKKILKAGMALAIGLSGQERWESGFNLACTYSEWGKDQEALAALETYFEGLRGDHWKIDVDKVLRDSSFTRFHDHESFKKLITSYSKTVGDPGREKVIRIPVAGRRVEILLPETTRFETGETPDYAIRVGAAKGTKFNISLSRNRGDIPSLKKLARSIFEKMSRGHEEENRKFIDKGTFYVLWLKTELEGVPMTQLSIRGYYRDRDLFLDLHVSAMNPTKEDEARMMRMIESVKISKR
jgi:tetratricopeptide (TPR) repeat protein